LKVKNLCDFTDTNVIQKTEGLGHKNVYLRLWIGRMCNGHGRFII